MTHDLGYLVTLVELLPREVGEARWLTPWAGGWRYDAEGSPINRQRALVAAEQAVEWANGIVEEIESPGPSAQ